MREGLNPASAPSRQGPVVPSRASRQRVVRSQERAPSLPFLLATKIVPPQLPAGLIERPRLLEMLAHGRSRRLTVIKAPAGFGKTSLALAWLTRLQADGVRTAWLSLDEEDDEPARFLSHLAASLHRACGDTITPAIGLTVNATLVPPRTVVSALINALAEADGELCLFLDDYHLISLAAIHDAMALLLSHAPANVHLVLGTRADPPLPLARLRASHELLELDASALRFSFDETQRFLARECAGGLAQRSVSTLHATTEGWAAALRISASMLTRGGPGLDAADKAPSGASRPIAAYLEDMLGRLPADLVEFMLRTSILDRLTGPLCEAVTGAANSQEMLETIANRQLLLDPLDLEGRWFRYHRLLRDYLCERLSAKAGGEVAALHQRACRWYAAAELWADAVRHAIAAGDTTEALALIGRCAMALVRKGDLLTLLGWQRQLPAELLRGQASVRLAIAWGMALAIRFEEALEMLDTLERDADAGALAGRDASLWECRAIRAVVTALQDRPQAALQLAQACLDHPPSTANAWTTNVLSNVVRFGHWKAGRLEQLYATPWVPESIDDDHRSVFSSVYRLCLLGLAELQQMHFTLAERCFVQSMDLARQHAGPQSMAAALCAPLIAQLRYEQDRLDEADALIIDRIPLISAAVLLDGALLAYTLLARIAAAKGNLAQAHAWLDQAQALGHARGWRRLIAATLFERIRLQLSEGRVTEAGACVSQLGSLADAAVADEDAVTTEIGRYRSLGEASVAMARRLPQEAAAALGTVLERFEHRRGDYLALRARTMLALAWLAAGERKRAVEACREVLAAIESAQAYRTIIDQGPEIDALLRAVREDSSRTAPDEHYLDGIDQMLERSRARYPARDTSTPAPERETLSARERGILDLIAAGQSNKEIARTLGIAPETVKTHIKNIFVKLAVDKRAQAVARAQSLGLVAGH